MGTIAAKEAIGAGMRFNAPPDSLNSNAIEAMIPKWGDTGATPGSLHACIHGSCLRSPCKSTAPMLSRTQILTKKDLLRI